MAGKEVEDLVAGVGEQQAVTLDSSGLLAADGPKHDGGKRVQTELSIVIPVFNEEESLGPLHDQLMIALKGLGRSLEIIYVDDGCTDNSFRKLQAIANTEAIVRVIRFRRNFGQTAALQAGVEYSRGAVVVFIDGERE